jgi:hypothetical protein
MSSSGAGGEAGAESKGDAGLGPDREPDRDPEPEPEPGPDPNEGADSGGGSDAGAEERFGGVKNSGVAGTRVTGEEGEADWEAGAGRGTGAGITGPTGVCAAFVSAAVVSAKDWVPGSSAARLIATAASAWEERLLVRGLIRGGVHEF